jgi:hypothetical protein
VEFEQARKLSVILDDQQGVAYADLRICEAHSELGELASAQRECESAGRIFAASACRCAVRIARACQRRVA